MNIKQSITRACLLASCLLLSAVSLLNAAAQAGADQSLGDVNFKVSCNSLAQREFNDAVARLHHMMYVQAEEGFRAILAKDPQCAMANWGIAMTRFHPLWSGNPSEQDLTTGTAALAKARAGGPLSPREEAYLSAAESFYKDWQTVGHRERLAVWEAAQYKVYRAYPEDPDAVALYALSHLATAPKADKSFRHQKAAGLVLETLHENFPRHPAGFHYLIHAYDNPMLAPRAEAAARGYADIAPDVPHALHMPAHIFVRLGLWQDTVDWNRRSARAAARQPVEGAVSKHYVHAVDYMVYGHLQQSQDKAAREALDDLLAKERLQPGFTTAYGLAAAQARYPLERGQWAEAAGLKPETPSTFAWGKYPAVVAISHFARGIGAARSGNPAIAGETAKSLDTLHAELTAKEDRYWSVLVDAQRKGVQAWIALAAGEQDKALRLMREAADLEDSVDKHPVTPGSVLPARELLGDMLLTIGRPAEALTAYKRSLKSSPNRFRSLTGARTAAEETGSTADVRRFGDLLEGLVVGADTDRKVPQPGRMLLTEG